MKTKEPKFKVGDWVTIKGLPNTQLFHVLEIIQQRCEAGIEQVTYSGRHFVKSSITDNNFALSTRELRLREMELGELAEVL